MLPDGPAADLHHLDGPYHPPHIVGVDALRRFGVDRPQPLPQSLVPLPFGQLPQAFPQRLVAGDILTVLHIVNDGLDIKPRPAAQHRHLSPPQNVIDRFSGQVGIVRHRKAPVDGQKADEMVRDCRQLLRGGLCRGDIHPPVNLHTVGGNDLSPHRLGQLYGQRRFPGGRRPRHHQQRIRLQPHGSPSFRVNFTRSGRTSSPAPAG